MWANFKKKKVSVFFDIKVDVYRNRSTFDTPNIQGKKNNKIKMVSCVSIIFEANSFLGEDDVWHEISVENILGSTGNHFAALTRKKRFQRKR